MQAYAGSVSFNANDPQGSITQMVVDGTQGTSQGPGLVQWFNDQDSVGYNTGGNPYNVARGYNSGSIDFSNLSNGLGSTAAYVSDIANRLQVNALEFLGFEENTDMNRVGMEMMERGIERRAAFKVHS